VFFRFRPHPLPGTGSPLLPRDRPILDLHIHGPAATRKVEALVDTGADDVILPVDLARPLGLDLTQARSRGTRVVGGRVTTYFFPVELEIVVAPDDRLRWAATVGFGPTPPALGLFGVAGGLEFIQLTASVVGGWFALAPHPLVRPLPPTAYPHQPLAAP
jgi:hypothetical protein